MWLLFADGGAILILLLVCLIHDGRERRRERKHERAKQRLSEFRDNLSPKLRDEFDQADQDRFNEKISKYEFNQILKSIRERDAKEKKEARKKMTFLERINQ